MKKSKILLLTGACVLTMATGVIAANYRTVEAVVKNDLTIIMDGNKLNMKDANGNTVEPVIIDGTTYLPLRPLAETIGKKVTWNGDTQTITLGELSKVNLISDAKTLQAYYGGFVQGEANLTFDNIGDTGVKYTSGIRITTINSAEKETKIALNNKYQHMDCDVLVVSNEKGTYQAKITNTDTNVAVLAKEIEGNKIYHCTGLDVSGVINMTFAAKGIPGGNATIYFLNPVVY